MSAVRPERLHWKLTTTASCASAWALLSDTDRFNRVAGLQMRFSEQANADGSVVRTGRSQVLGVPLHWREHPFEWTEGERFSVRRDFAGGPARSYTFSLSIAERPAGTEIECEVVVTPRSTWTRLLLAAELSAFTRPALDRALVRAVAVLDGIVSQFDHPPPPLSPEAERRLDAALGHLEDATLRARIGAFLRHAPIDEQQTIAPLRLARRWGVEADALIVALLGLVDAGLLELRWSLRCPSCRVGKATTPKLSAQPLAAHCTACNIAYDGSLPDSLIAALRPAAALRTLHEDVRCIGSPARTPHLVSSTLLEAGETVDVHIGLLAGRYRLRTLPAGGTASLQVRADRVQDTIDVDLGAGSVDPPLLRAKPGLLVLHARNRRSQSTQLLIERVDQADDLLTVGRLLEIPSVLALLPPDLLAQGLSVQASAGIVVVARVERGGLGAAKAVADAFAAYEPNGLMVRGGVVIATFTDAQRALGAASLVQGAAHLGSGLASGALLRIEASGEAMPAGTTVERALAAAGVRGALRCEGVDAARAPLDSALAQPGIARFDDETGLALEIGPPKRSSPPLSDRPPAPAPAPGELLAGRFHILRPLGAGGFGAVWLVRDQMLEREVVVKLLHASLAADLAHLQRFYNEGRLAARVDSPRVARVIDYGVDDVGRVWMASERLHGEELAVVLHRRRVLDAWLAVHLGWDVALALADVHRAGLVHRDIKPANVFVCDSDGPRPIARLIDFGIAKAQGEDLLLLRSDTTLIGTPHYMAPEQARGQPVDGRSDLYAFGMVLYEALAGRLPFDGSTALEMLFARLQGAPQPLSRHCGCSLPAGLEALVMSLLAANPAERPQSADEVAARLAAIAAAMGPASDWRRSDARSDADADAAAADAAAADEADLNARSEYAAALTATDPTSI